MSQVLKTVRPLLLMKTVLKFKWGACEKSPRGTGWESAHPAACIAIAPNKMPFARLHHLIAFLLFHTPKRELSLLCHSLLCHSLLCHAGCAARLAIQIGCMRGSRGCRRCSHRSSGRSIISISHGIDRESRFSLQELFFCTHSFPLSILCHAPSLNDSTLPSARKS